MHQIIEILRLRHERHLSIRDIALSCGIARSTVGDYLAAAATAKIGWPLPEGLPEAELVARLQAVPAPEASGAPQPPDWAYIHQELRRPNVTLRLLWKEYLSHTPDGLQYSRFCERYQQWSKTLEPTLRQIHLPGEKMFVDWAGATVPIGHPGDGTQEPASIFVASLGASGLVFARAFPDQQLHSWISAHVQALAFYGGVPSLIVPDNPRTGVTKACRFEPILHRTYQELAEHYGTVVLPARPRKPRDKARVESAVQIAQNQILAALRDRVFFSVAEINQAIAAYLEILNHQPFQRLEGTRRGWFEQMDRACLRPLPPEPYRLATWREATASIDYHVLVDHHHYSVPYTLIHQRLQVRLGENTVELFHKGHRVAVHPRGFQKGGFTTVAEHRPKAHQRHLEWTPGRIVEWARQTGPYCVQVVERVMASRPHPEQGFRSCLGIIRLGRRHGKDRLEAACRRALHFGILTYRSIDSILERRLDAQPLEADHAPHSPSHENLRGQQYFL